ncbi:MAG TPA: hypothetical protein VND63_07405 [Rhodanobacteraceae bacterium]|nr:hypothetical protein [Rhodanobacteraceae bacterium]
MHKRLLLLVLLAAGGAVHAQDVLIPGRQLTAGKADAQLAQIAREAAREHKVLVVNAPSYWQARIAKAIHAADPAADIRFNDSFFEHVLIRLSDRTAAAVAAAPAQPPHAEVPVIRAEPPRREVRTPEMRVAVRPAARPEPAVTVGAARPATPAAHDVMPAPVAATPPPVVRALPAQPAAPVASAAPTAASPARDSAAVDAALRQEMQQVLNAGRPAFGDLHESQLDPGDVVYVNADLRAVVRRDALGQAMYWLTGSVNLDRAQYRPLGQGRYEVIGNIDPTAPLQLRRGSDTVVFDSQLPAAASPARARLQRLYAGGQDVDAHLGVAGLRSGDVLYTGTGAALVVRQGSYGRSRYWLVGHLDLGQTGLQRMGSNAYRVIGIVK